MNGDLDSLLEGIRQKLVEIGTRNRLINVNRKSQRANVLNIINERTEDIFRILRVDGKSMRFWATGSDDDDFDQVGDDLLLAVEEEAFDESRYVDNKLETPLSAEQQQRRLLRLFRDSKTAEEEQGSSILFLAMGFLSWYESGTSSIPREAPLILLPVDLVRDKKVSSFKLVCRDDDITTNLSLQGRLGTDFGIQLPEIDDSEEWQPSEYFDRVDEVIHDRQGWRVDRDGMQLGFFSFAKILMLRDLEKTEWLKDSELVENLLQGGGFTQEAPLFRDDENLDKRLDPADIIQVVDADASQTRVIEEVRAGRNLVVQGPPGTGKSQTITNIIAAAVHDGKSVLFMAEKMAALNVVHDRLKKVGLRHLCLELHSHRANKKAVLAEIKSTMSFQSVGVPASTPDELRRARDKLNEVADMLHQQLPEYGYTPFSVIADISDFMGRGVPPPGTRSENLHKLTDSDRNSCVQDIMEFCETIDRSGIPAEHPFLGVADCDLQPTDIRRLEGDLGNAVMAVDKYLESAGHVSSALSYPAVETLRAGKVLIKLLAHSVFVPQGSASLLRIFLARKGDVALREALNTGSAWRKAVNESGDVFASAAWSAQVDQARAKIAQGVGSFWSRLVGGYRGASREFATLLKTGLPSSPGARLKLVDRLLEIQRLRKELSQDENLLSKVLGEYWRGERTDFASMAAVCQWVEKLSAIDPGIDDRTAAWLYQNKDKAVEYGKELTEQLRLAEELITGVIDRLKLDTGTEASVDGLGLPGLRNRFATMREEHGRYDQWAELVRGSGKLDSAGLSDLREKLEKGNLPSEQAVDEFKYAVAEQRWNYILKQHPELNRGGDLGNKRDQLVAAFRRLEQERIENTRNLVLARHLEQLPGGDIGEMSVIRGEIAKKTRHKPIRRLIGAAGGMMQRIKPVFLMSPISVAQFLPPEKIKFDILVIDEASQVRPEDAIGAMARVGQIVVVGDQKQLPPTTFFSRLTDNDLDEDEEEGAVAKATDMESILTLCEARNIRSCMLEWHYRSRDPSLITVSNKEFYDDRLVLIPSPLMGSPDYGLKFRYVEGVYSSRGAGGGRAGTNRVEAEAIAQELSEHARDNPTVSVGVVAFSKAQSDMISEVLEVRRRDDKHLDGLLREDKKEDVFVKNIENVQGDERDVILISVGYGPNEAGGRLTSMRFGPVNNEGGGRRLNVLFSRARCRCEVFASFHPGDIDLSRTGSDGVRILKRFLNYAKTGKLDERIVTGMGADSPFEEDVARVIASHGYLADPQVGSAGFRIDIGVRHPDKLGKYILAVECDGARYHSALWARERDRLRQDVLEGLGWDFHRIWSTDWFYGREDEIKRLGEALARARKKHAGEPPITGSNNGSPTPASEPGTPGSQETVVPVPQAITVPAYKKADIEAMALEAVRSVESNERESLRMMAEVVTEIVVQEGPIHSDEVARRLATVFSSKAGANIKSAVIDGLEVAESANSICRQGDFWFTAEQEQKPPVRDRSGETGTILKAEYLSPLEIRTAAKMIKAENGVMAQDEMARAVARLLGFARVGDKLRAAIVGAMAGQ